MPLMLPPRDLLAGIRELQFTIGELTRHLDAPTDRPLAPGERALFGLIVPSFQRPVVWTTLQSIRFIESIWLKNDIGRYLVNISDLKDAPGKFDRTIIDGQQRLTAIERYVRDEFAVFGAKYSELTPVEVRRFNNRGFTRYETSFHDEQDLRTLYDRLSFGGVPHQAEKTIAALNAARDIIRKEIDGEPIGPEVLHDAEMAVEVALEEWEPERYLAEEVKPPLPMM